MATSYQQEIPPARVNITLDIDTGGAQKKKELPLKLLVLGDFSHGKTTGSVGDREKIAINKENLDQVINDLNPSINMTILNKIKNDNSQMRVNLSFNGIKAFHPENIAQQIPELQRLLSMRILLKDLKANIIDKQAFRKELENVLKKEFSVNQLIDELNQITAKSNDGGV